MRLIGIRSLSLLQIFDIGLEVPLELRTRKRGYVGIGVPFIGEMAARRVEKWLRFPVQLEGRG
jgi:hypothetical protein